MKMAKASAHDMEVMLTFAGIFNDVDSDQFPRNADGNFDEDDPEYFDPDEIDHLRAFYERIMAVYQSAPGALNRVVGGFHVLMHNDLVDPDKSYLDFHPRFKEMMSHIPEAIEDGTPI